MSTQRMGFGPAANENAALGARLKKAREYVGLKQDQVAEHLAIPRTGVSEIESGKRGVSAIELQKLARLYRRPVAWFTDDETDGAVPPDVVHLARTAGDLSVNDRQELQRFAEFLRAKSTAS